MGKQLSVWSPRPCAAEKEILSPRVVLYGMPMMSICPLEVSAVQQRQIMESDAIIFISQYAVQSLFDQLSPRLFADKTIIAIGEKTSATLKKYNVSVFYSGNAPYTSESLLADEIFSRLHYESVAIIAGLGGLNILEKSLQQKHRRVFRIACYQRYKCHVEPEIMLEFTKNYSINSIVFTSCEIVDAVVCQMRYCGMRNVNKMQVFTLSQRIADYAKKLGFVEVIVAKEASRQSLYGSMLSWAEK